MKPLIHIDDGGDRSFYHSICGRFSSDVVDPVRRSTKESCIVRGHQKYFTNNRDITLCKDCIEKAALFDLAEVDI